MKEWDIGVWGAHLRLVHGRNGAIVRSASHTCQESLMGIGTGGFLLAKEQLRATRWTLRATLWTLRATQLMIRATTWTLRATMWTLRATLWMIRATRWTLRANEDYGRYSPVGPHRYRALHDDPNVDRQLLPEHKAGMSSSQSVSQSSQSASPEKEPSKSGKIRANPKIYQCVVQEA
eukprot:3177831-Pyramimonas_sp.AAC.2